MTKKIGLIVGSLRKGSYNRIVLKKIQELLPKDWESEFIEIGDLPLYNEDIDGDNPPSAYVDFRAKISEKDAFIFATPEYNRSLPGVMKNAIDVGSRPPGHNAWDGKVAAVVSASPGQAGGASSNLALRQVLLSLNVLVMPQPEVFLSQIHKYIDEDGNLAERTVGFLQRFVDAFVRFIEKVSD